MQSTRKPLARLLAGKCLSTSYRGVILRRGVGDDLILERVDNTSATPDDVCKARRHYELVTVDWTVTPCVGSLGKKYYIFRRTVAR